MLTRAREHVPKATFTRVDLLGEWPAEMRNRSFDRVVSSYVLHEFPDALKLKMLTRLASETTASDGRILIGDILFANARARAETQAAWCNAWDDEEHYATADNLVSNLHETGLSARFEQISFCAGVLEISS